MPTQQERECVGDFGFWETLYYDVNGMLSRLARKDGYCVEAVDQQVECEQFGGFWQFGYWSLSGEWKSTEGRCSFAPKEAYEIPRHDIIEATDGENFDAYDFIDDEVYY